MIKPPRNWVQCGRTRQQWIPSQWRQIFHFENSISLHKWRHLVIRNAFLNLSDSPRQPATEHHKGRRQRKTLRGYSSKSTISNRILKNWLGKHPDSRLLKGRLRDWVRLRWVLLPFLNHGLHLGRGLRLLLQALCSRLENSKSDVSKSYNWSLRRIGIYINLFTSIYYVCQSHHGREKASRLFTCATLCSTS